MTKETLKSMRFLSPHEQSKLRKDIRGFFQFFPNAEGDRPEFEEDLDIWLDGESWTALKSLFKNKPFKDWAEQTIERVRASLLKLHTRYDIPPSAVLTLLGYFKIDSLSVDEVKSGNWIQTNTNIWYKWFSASEIIAIKSRSRKKVEKDAKALRVAARILEQWERPVRMSNHSFADTYPHGFEVREVARTLDLLGKTRAYRPEERQIKTYAKVLAEFFELKTRTPLYEYIGHLLKAGFHDKWNPAGDNPREAAKKLVKAPFSVNEFPRISPLALTFPSPLGSIKTGLREALWMCSVRGRLIGEIVKPNEGKPANATQKDSERATVSTPPLNK